MNIKHIISIFSLSILCAVSYAGNPDRLGQAGSTHLLINPWAGSAGWQGAFTAGVSGVEAMRFNVGGLSRVKGLELRYSRTNWLEGGDIFVNSVGFATSIGEDKANTIGLTLMSFDMGDFVRTTTDNPDGDLGTFSPSYSNIGVAFSREFSNSIRGGFVLRVVSESIPDVQASGAAFDAGIQYQTGGEAGDRFKFGMSLRNVGPPLKYEGDGLTTRAVLERGSSDIGRSLEVRAETFELPSVLHIGLGYDFYLAKNDSTGELGDHILTAAANFMSNSFGKDLFTAGLCYKYKKFLAFRAGLAYEDGAFDEDNTTTIELGPSTGVSLTLPFGKEKDKSFGIDYSYRLTQEAYQGIHAFGASLRF